MKLYGSLTSPYVRRLRLLMENIDYEFIPLNIFEEKDRAILNKVTPIGKIPVLENGHETILDSRQIFEYLCESSVHPRINWERKNLLTLIDGVNDTLINFLLLNRSQIEIPKDSQFYKVNVERIEEGLKELDRLVARKEFEQWDYASMCLYCLLDWIKFRGLYDLSPYKNFESFLDKFKDDPCVIETKPN